MIEWQLHRTLKHIGREGEGDESDSDGNKLSWRKVPFGVKFGLRYPGDGTEGSLALASIYGNQDCDHEPRVHIVFGVLKWLPLYLFSVYDHRYISSHGSLVQIAQPPRSTYAGEHYRGE